MRSAQGKVATGSREAVHSQATGMFGARSVVLPTVRHGGHAAMRREQSRCYMVVLQRRASGVRRCVPWRHHLGVRRLAAASYDVRYGAVTPRNNRTSPRPCFASVDAVSAFGAREASFAPEKREQAPALPDYIAKARHSPARPATTSIKSAQSKAQHHLGVRRLAAACYDVRYGANTARNDWTIRDLVRTKLTPYARPQHAKQARRGGQASRRRAL